MYAIVDIETTGGQPKDSKITEIGIVISDGTKVIETYETLVNPERDIPMGIFLSLGVAIVTYIIGLVIMIGVMPADQLAASYTPAADAAELLMGRTGQVVMSIAAVAAFDITT